VIRGLIRTTAVLTIFALVGCKTVAMGSEGGAASSAQAVAQFLAAAKSQDLQAVGAVWGNEESPTRDRIEREEYERRVLIMMCHLRHDAASVGAAAPGEQGRVLHRAELSQGEKTASVQFTTVRNRKSGRWYVFDFDLGAVREFCRSGSTATPPV
jgi:hypothetical protein